MLLGIKQLFDAYPEIQKFLQKTRAAIVPNSRDTQDSLALFFGPWISGSEGGYLDRQVFLHAFPALCDPELRLLTPACMAEFKQRWLESVATAVHAEGVECPATPTSASKPKI